MQKILQPVSSVQRQKNHFTELFHITHWMVSRQQDTSVRSWLIGWLSFTHVKHTNKERKIYEATPNHHVLSSFETNHTCHSAYTQSSRFRSISASELRYRLALRQLSPLVCSAWPSPSSPLVFSQHSLAVGGASPQIWKRLKEVEVKTSVELLYKWRAQKGQIPFVSVTKMVFTSEQLF